MSKASKRRQRLFMDESLAHKLDNLNDDAEKDVYSSKKSEDEYSFLDIVEESLSKEELKDTQGSNKSESVPPMVILAIIVISILTLCVGVFVFARVITW